MAASRIPTASQGAFRRTWRMARGWYGSEERGVAWALTAATLVLTLAQIGTQLRLNLWHRDFFNAMILPNIKEHAEWWDNYSGVFEVSSGNREWAPKSHR